MSKGSDDDWGTGAFENSISGSADIITGSSIFIVTTGREDVEPSVLFFTSITLNVTTPRFSHIRLPFRGE